MSSSDLVRLDGADLSKNGEEKLYKVNCCKMRTCENQEDKNSKKNHVDHGQTFLSTLVKLILQDVVEKGLIKDRKVIEFMHPENLEKELDLSLNQNSTSDADLIQLCHKIIKYSVKTGHPYFFNQLYGGLDLYGLAGSWLTDALNTSQYTYEVAPVFTLMEKSVLSKMLDYTGFQSGDGLFCPGGSLSNMYALNLARFKMFPDVKLTGLSGLPTLCILTSEKGHYSIKKGAALLGIGMNNAIPVKTDSAGRMIPAELEVMINRCKSEGKVPFVVNATAGSTVLGAYDPLNAIADVCERHGLWMHVDGAWGGSVLLSEKLKSRMAGVERADSFAWNPHKMMGAPLQTAAFLTKHKDLLRECHSTKAQYLFQQDKFYDVSYDTGDKSIQCGRKVDVLKLWMMWKSKGTNEFAAGIENLFHCANYLLKKLTETDGFRLVLHKPECTNVCFWFIPPSLRHCEETQEWWDKLSKVAPVIKQRMMEQGTMLIGYQPDGDLVNFFRMIVNNHNATEQDMDFVVKEITRLGEDL